MRTSKSISTVSYNSESFLKDNLDALVSEKKIQFYMYILHMREEDELKNHFHVYIEPNKLIDSMDLQFRLKELNPDNLNKPFGCQPFRYSKIDDAIPYFLHDVGYLALKNESRIYSYDYYDMVVSDEYYYHDLYIHAFKASDWSKEVKLLDKLCDDDLPPCELIQRGYVPWNMSTQLNAYYNMKKQYGTIRNGGGIHE